MSDAHNPYAPPMAEVSDPADSDAARPASRPKAINLALLLLGVQVLYTVIVIVSAMVERGSVAGRVGALFIGGFDIAFTLLLGLFVVRGRNWARVVLLVLFTFSLTAFVLRLYLWKSGGLPEGMYYATSWSHVVSIIAPLLLKLIIVVLLFGPGRSWFRKRAH